MAIFCVFRPVDKYDFGGAHSVKGSVINYDGGGGGGGASKVLALQIKLGGGEF